MTIKKILCPVDFSKASENAMEYAAKLAVKTKAEVTLAHVMSLPEIYENLSTLGQLTDFVSEENEIETKLQAFVKQVSIDFKISCKYKIDFSLSKSIPSKNEEGMDMYDIIVCGTNGADTFSQFYFGSNSYRISKNAGIPTLVIPENCSFKEIKNIVFTTGYNKGDHLLIGQLKSFMADFDPSLTILHVSEKETAVSQEVYHAFSHLVDEAFDYQRKLNFQRIVNEDEAGAIEQFMENSKADLLAVCMEEHSFLYRIFHQSLVKKITSYAKYPIMIFHK